MQIATELELLGRKLQTHRTDAIAAYKRQHQPEHLVQQLSAISDHALTQLGVLCPLPSGLVIAAVGGYGRQELYPYSDTDLLILLPNQPGAEAQEQIAHFVAAMWDIGLNPSHSVRTIEQCLEHAQSDVTIETALLETRCIFGETHLLDALHQELRQQLDMRAFFLAKRAEMQRRHAHYQDTPYALEPNCKESPGALRDLQVLLWLAQASGLGNSWPDVVRNGALTHAEARSLKRAERAFRRLRIEIHLLAKRREDRVLFDLQPALAKAYGIKSSTHRQASEILMQRYYWAARVVSQLTHILMASFEERLFISQSFSLHLDDDFCITNSRLDIARSDAFERNPALIFRAFLCIQENAELQGMTARTQRAIWHARTRIDSQFRRNPVNNDLFLRILKQPQRVASTLRHMSMLNILPRYLPAFRRVVGLMQHDLFHAYTVDEHTLKVIGNLRRFTQAEYTHEFPLASQLMADFKQPWRLLVAAFFHDIGKGQGGDHSTIGARLAQDFCTKHHVGKEDTHLIIFLVKHHLFMSRVAQKLDLSDPAIISTFTKTVSSPERLNALYLLTVADIRATNPKIWNAWKDKLLTSLYERSLLALGGTKLDSGTVLLERKKQAENSLKNQIYDKKQIQDFWKLLDTAYFLRHEAHEIAWHTLHIAPYVAQERTLVKARLLGDEQTLQVLVWTPDKAGLFATICQYFDHHTLDIQEAKIHTTRHGWALDSFIVLLHEHAQTTQDIPEKIESELQSYLEHPPVTSHKTRSKPKRYYARRSRAFPIPASIDLRPDASSTQWRLFITATDRPGLLVELAYFFSQYKINLKMAKVDTLAERAEDVFMLESDFLNNTSQRLAFEHDLLKLLDPVLP